MLFRSPQNPKTPNYDIEYFKKIKDGLGISEKLSSIVVTSVQSVEVRLEKAVLAKPFALRHVVEVGTRKELLFHVVEKLVRLCLVRGRESLMRQVVVLEFNQQKLVVACE